MVVSDVARQEVHNAGKLVERSALDGGGQVVPVLGPLHVGMLMLVLHVEEPESNDAKEEDNGPLDNQEGFPAQEKTKAYVDGKDQEIVNVLLAVNRTPAFKVDPWYAECNSQIDNGYYDEQDHRVAENAVFQAAPTTQFTVFAYGQEVNVSNVTVLQLSGMPVVKAMHSRPVGVRNRAEERTNKTNGVIDFTLF